MAAMVESIRVGSWQGRSAVTARGEVGPEMLAAAIRGDRPAFVAILHHYDRVLRLVAWQVLGDRDLMDDVLQEVALKAWRGLPGFRGEAALGTWLSRLTYNASVDLLRRLRPDELAWTAVQLPDEHDAPTTADPAESVAEIAALRAAFAALPAEQRVTVMLIDREGYDYRTVADLLDVRPGTVASRLNRAHAALRSALVAPSMKETPS